MNKLFIYSSVAVLLLSVASCQKDAADGRNLCEPLVFTASASGQIDTKTVLTSGKKVNWETGDEITVNGVVYTATPKADATKAEFKKKNIGDADPAGTYNAFYPSGIQSGVTAGGTLPAVQSYAAGKITNVPMFATSTTTSLEFRNICAVLAITVKSADFPTVRSIRVSSSNLALSGAFSVSGGQTAVLSSPSVIANTVTLSCSTPVSTDAGGTLFNIAIPAQTYRNLKIELSADGSSYSKSMTTRKDVDIAVAVNMEYPLTFKADPSVFLPGEFAVSATKKVKFTKGNLWWDGSDWHLESNQTDYPGETWSASHVGHFFWTKTADKSYAYTYSESSTSGSDKLFADGSDASHTLTVDGQSGLYLLSGGGGGEWDYLINTRTNASALYKKNVTVNGVASCLVIAPDSFTGTIADSYDAAAWKTAEASGLVCLPPAGYRDSDESGFNFQGTQGCYWSASPSGTNSACYLYFSAGNVLTSGGEAIINRSRAFSVRLVSTVSE